MVPMFHYVTLGIIAVALVGSLINLVLVIRAGAGGLYSAILMVTMAVGLTLTAFYARAFPTAVQDRMIRREENERHVRRTGNPLDPRLTLRQIIGLRFAPDEEFDDLAARAISEGLSEKAIKQAIKNWRGDYFRV